MSELSLLQHEIAARLCLTLAHSLWQFGLLAGLWWLSARFVRRTETSYALAVATLVLGLLAMPATYAFVSPPVCNAPLAESTIEVTSLSPVPESIAAGEAEMRALQGVTPHMNKQTGEFATSTPSAANTLSPLAIPVTEQPGMQSALWVSYAPWIAGVYAAGVFFMLVRLAWGFWRASCLSRSAHRIDNAIWSGYVTKLADAWRLRLVPLVKQSEQIVVPRVIGLLRPTVLIPTAALAGLPTSELEMILAHELAHVRRHDMWVHLVQRLAEAVLFFNPALWYLSRRIGTLREYCCDELVCEAVEPNSEHHRLRYAEALLHAVELNQSAQGAAAVASLAASGRSPSELRRRVARLFGEPIREPVRITRSGVLAVAASVLLLLAGPAVWTTQAADEPAESVPADVASDAVSNAFDEAFEQAKEKQATGPAKISGTVVLEDGSPADAKGWLYSQATMKREGNSTSSRSSTEGQFSGSFTCEVPAGTVWLAYFPEGYAPTWAGPFELKPGETLDGVTFKLTPGLSVNLILQDEEGKRVSNATVVAHPKSEADTPSPVNELHTDEGGELVLEHLADTEYKLVINAPGYEPLHTAPLRVEQGETLRPTMIRSKPGTGVVRFADGTPAPNTKICAITEFTKNGKTRGLGNQGEGFWGSPWATTDSGGRFELNQLASGSKYLFVLEAMDFNRVIVRDLVAGNDNQQIVLPERRDLAIRIKGDLSKLKTGRNKPFVAVRQPVIVTRENGGTYQSLIGSDVTIEPTDGDPQKGGMAIFRGLAVEQDPKDQAQQVWVTLGYDSETKQTIDIKPRGNVVEFDLDGEEPPAEVRVIQDRFVLCQVTTDVQRTLLDGVNSSAKTASACLLVNAAAFATLEEIDEDATGIAQLGVYLNEYAQRDSREIRVRLIEHGQGVVPFDRQERMTLLDEVLRKLCTEVGFDNVHVTSTYGVSGGGNPFEWQAYIAQSQQATADRTPKREAITDLGYVRVMPIETFLSHRLSNADCIVDVKPIVRDAKGVRFVEDILSSVAFAVKNSRIEGGKNLTVRLRYSETARPDIEGWIEDRSTRKAYAQDLGFERCNVSMAGIAKSAEKRGPPPEDRGDTYRYPVSVNGLALDTTGKPIAGATIYLAAQTPGYQRLAETTTDTSGRYRFRNVSLPIKRADTTAGRDSGSFEVFGTAEDYALAWRKRRYLTPTLAVNGNTSPGNPRADRKLGYGRDEGIELDLTFQQPTSFSGRVVDDLGNPIPGTQLAIRYCDTEWNKEQYNISGFEGSLNSLNERQIVPPSVKIRSTDDAGRFEFTGLPPGYRWQVWVHPPGFPNRRVWVVTGHDVGNDAKRRVYSGEFELVFQRPKPVTVQVTYADTGKPADKVMVSLGNDNASAHATSDENGRVKLSVPDGEYRLGLVQRINTPYLRGNQSVTINEQTRGETIPAKLNPAAVANITVIDANTGAPLKDVDVWKEKTLSNGEPYREVHGYRSWEVETRISHYERPRTDENGKMRVLFEPGTHRIGVGKDAYPKGYISVEQDGREVDLTSGETTEIRFEMRTKSRPQGDDAVGWGGAIDGLQVRLAAKKLIWPAGTPPAIQVELRNTGTAIAAAPRILQQCKIEIDGKLYQHDFERTIAGYTSISRRTGTTSISGKLGEGWQTKDGVPLVLKPGKHTVRVKVYSKLVTQPVVIEVVDKPTAEMAERRRLIRRIALDLTGLPPDADLLERLSNEPIDDSKKYRRWIYEQYRKSMAEQSGRREGTKANKEAIDEWLQEQLKDGEKGLTQKDNSAQLTNKQIAVRLNRLAKQVGQAEPTSEQLAKADELFNTLLKDKPAVKGMWAQLADTDSDEETKTRITAYEEAFRLQGVVPELSPAALQLYDKLRQAQSREIQQNDGEFDKFTLEQIKGDLESVDATLQAGGSLMVKLQDNDGKPVVGALVLVYDGNNFWAGQPVLFQQESGRTNENGIVEFAGIGSRIPRGKSCRVQVQPLEGADWQARYVYLGIHKGEKVGSDPLIAVEKSSSDDLAVTFTLREPCPIDVAIVDAKTNERIHFAQLLFKDDRVKEWIPAALQDYVGGNDDPTRLGLNFRTTMIPERSDAQFMATHEGFYPTEFQLNQKLTPNKKLVQRVKLKPAPPIELTILQPDGKPAVGAKLKYVGLNIRGSYSPIQPTDAQGRTTLKFPELGELARWKITHPSGEAEVDAKWWLKDHVEGEAIEAKVRLLDDTFSIQGKVIDEAGKPIAGAQVRAATGYGTLRGGGRTTTNEQGHYTLRFGRGMTVMEDYAPLRVGVQAAHFYVEKPGWQLSEEEGYVFYLMTDQTPEQFAKMLQDEGGEYWGKSSDDEVIYPNQPREVNLVLKREEKENQKAKPAAPASEKQAERATQTSGDADTILVAKVVDAETGEPIEKFAALPGVNRLASMGFVWQWQPHLVTEFANGKLVWPPRGRRAYRDDQALRIEAEGYLPAETPTITQPREQPHRKRRPEDTPPELFEPLVAKPGEPARVTIRLERDPGVRGVVVDANGKPVQDVTVAITMGNHRNVTVNEGVMWFRQEADQSLRDKWVQPRHTVTNAAGEFTLPSEIQQATVIAASPKGYARLSYNDLILSGEIKIQAWGRVEGRAEWNGTPAAGERIRLDGQSTLTDDQGRFVFEYVRPGEVYVGRHALPKGDKSGWIITNPNGRLNVAPGTTTQCVFGGKGRPIVGRVTGFKDWQNVTVSVHLDLRWPSMSFRSQGDPTMSAFGSYVASPYYRHYDKAEFSINSDGTFRLDDVPAEQYAIVVTERTGDQVTAQGESKFTINLLPTGKTDAPQDIGIVKISPDRRVTSRKIVPLTQTIGDN